MNQPSEHQDHLITALTITITAAIIILTIAATVAATRWLIQ